MTLGGRAAEDIIFGDVSTGAQNDLERITKMAYAMVTVYGMDETIGNVSFNDQKKEYSFDKPYSDETARIIDEKVRKMINESYVRTVKLLKSKKNDLEIVAQRLLEKELLFQDDLVKLIGERPFQETPPPEPSANGHDIKKDIKADKTSSAAEKKAENKAS
jgi:cell division protease FtsH